MGLRVIPETIVSNAELTLRFFKAVLSGGFKNPYSLSSAFHLLCLLRLVYDESDYTVYFYMLIKNIAWSLACLHKGDFYFKVFCVFICSRNTAHYLEINKME